METFFTESNLSSLDRAFLIMEKTNSIAIERALLEYDTYCNLESIYYEGIDFKKENEKKKQAEEDDFFSFGDEEEQPKKDPKKEKKKINLPKDGVLGKIFSAIDNFIKSFMEMFHNIFGKGEQLTAEEYLKSNAAQMQITSHCEEYRDMLLKKQHESNKLIQMIVNHTPVSDSAIDGVLNIGAEMWMKKEQKVVDAVAAYKINKHIAETIDGTRKEVKKMEELAANRAGNLSPKETKQILKIANSLNSTLVNMGKESTEMSKELQKRKK